MIIILVSEGMERFYRTRKITKRSSDTNHNHISYHFPGISILTIYIRCFPPKSFVENKIPPSLSCEINNK